MLHLHSLPLAHLGHETFSAPPALEPAPDHPVNPCRRGGRCPRVAMGAPSCLKSALCWPVTSTSTRYAKLRRKKKALPLLWVVEGVHSWPCSSAGKQPLAYVAMYFEILFKIFWMQRENTAKYMDLQQHSPPLLLTSSRQEHGGSL